MGFVVVILGLSATAGQAATIHVPGDYATIQAALDAAANTGDEVIVAPGTYPEAINFHGKAVYLHSSGGAAVTTIDATELNTSVVTSASGEGPGTVLEGFTITGGSGSFGGGMVNSNSSPTVTNCTFSGNSVALVGGGMYNSYSSPTVTNCKFSGNSCGNPGSNGGGMFNAGSGANPSVTDCTFSGNTAGYGGGMSNWYSSSPTVTNCTFTGNSASGYAGGIQQVGGTLTIAGCTFSGNSASYGGGIEHSGGTLTMTDCVFRSNIGSSGSGGGYSITTGNATLIRCAFLENKSPNGDAGGFLIVSNVRADLRDCVFVGNQARSASGGGLYCYNQVNVTLTNSTFSKNSAAYGGRAIHVEANSNGSVALQDCILWGDNGQEIFFGSGSSRVTYSDVQGGYAGTGNINVDPLFVDPNNGDLRVAAGSPCIDAGDPNFMPSPGETDLDGNKRVWDGNGDGTAIVDMGAYEFGSHPYGDVNCDGVIDFDDINAFVLALSDPAGYHVAYPTCDYLLADINADGTVNFDDINPFVAILSGGQ